MTSPALTAKGRQTREGIERAARKLFAERGFHGTTLADITSAAGKSSAAFYRYYADKEDLLYALAESFLPLGGVDAYNEPFKPQRGKQWEAGVKWQPAAAVTASLALYQLRDQNRKTTDPANPQNSLQLGEVKVRGAEFETAGSVKGWDWTAAYTYTDARVSRSNGADLGKRVSGIPKHNASTWLARGFSVGGVDGFTAGAGVRYLGTSWDGTDTLETPSVTLVDALLAYETGSWRFALNAVNLADKVQITTCLARGDCFYGQRRTVMLTARYLW